MMSNKRRTLPGTNKVASVLLGQEHPAQTSDPRRRNNVTLPDGISRTSMSVGVRNSAVLFIPPSFGQYYCDRCIVGEKNADVVVLLLILTFSVLSLQLKKLR